MWATGCVGHGVCGPRVCGPRVCGPRGVWATGCVGHGLCGPRGVWATVVGHGVCGPRGVWATGCVKPKEHLITPNLHDSTNKDAQWNAEERKQPVDV